MARGEVAGAVVGDVVEVEIGDLVARRKIWIKSWMII
jgi:hypothetical protein